MNPPSSETCWPDAWPSGSQTLSGAAAVARRARFQTSGWALASGYDVGEVDVPDALFCVWTQVGWGWLAVPGSAGYRHAVAEADRAVAVVSASVTAVPPRIATRRAHT